MKKVVLFLFVVLSLFCCDLAFSQGTPTNLDNMNGYKKLKFGMLKKDLNQFTFAPVGDFSNPKVEQTICSNYTSDYLTFGAKFSTVFVDFYSGKLYRVCLFKELTEKEFDNQTKLNTEYGLLTDFELIGNEITKLFGQISDENATATETSATHYVYGKSTTFIFKWSYENSIVNGEMVFYLTVEFIHNDLYNQAVVSGY